jgi:Ni,Fe-hydrogenase III small subunit/Pyruvate/2-oxoacid:ferredoxin oxidoreductase delta subunit
MLTLIKSIWQGKRRTEDITTTGSNRYRGKLEITDDSSCKECKKCLNVCPVNALKIDNKGKIQINYDNCIFCGKCVEACGEKVLQHTPELVLPELIEETRVIVGKEIKKRWGRSLHIRHFDSGSCNACEFELEAMNNPIYDLDRYGVSFVASPRHADILTVSGTLTRNLEEALHLTYDAMEEPKMVMAIGACAAGGETYKKSYALVGPISDVLPVDIKVPGCPPKPAAIIIALVAASDIFEEKLKSKKQK